MANRWTQAANLVTARSQACSVLLQDGRVLVAGGNTANGVANTVEVLSQNGNFLTAAPMLTPRANASCSLLADGRVFVTGGTDGAKTLASSELYDPAANVWTPSGAMGAARSGQTATVLPWGPVLLIGGTDADGNSVRTVEQYLPVTNTVAFIGNLSTARKDFGVAVTPDQHVLIAGGTDGGKVSNTIDVFDAPANIIKAGGALLTGRRNFGAATLLDGTVLFTGGYDAEGKVLGTSEIYDPVRGSTVAGPMMSGPRADHTAYTLPNNGSVLLVGGTDDNGLVSTSDVYSFQSGKFSVGGTVRTARTGAAQSLMKLGAMVMAGGRSGSTILASSELYTFSTIKTGKLDYHPGEVADMTGTGFVPGEQVAIVVTAFPLDQHNVEFTGTAVADAAGKIALGGFNIDKSHEGMKFLVTATGSQSVAQQVFTDAADTTSTTVTPSVNNVAYGTAVHFNVVVTDTTNGGNTPDGNVQVTVDGVSRGLFPLTPGTPSTLSTSDFTDITPGTHVINALYQGSATLPGFAASDSTAAPGSFTVNQVTTTTSVQTSQSTITRDQQVTFTAQVTGNGGTFVSPFSGTVAFTSSVDGALGSVSVSGVGAAALTVPANSLSVNTHTITATFTAPASPANSFTSSFGTVTQVVNAAPSAAATTTTITPTVASPQDYGTAVNFTVIVASASGTPTGSVTITDTTTGTVLASNLSLTAGTATMPTPTSNLTAVAHSIRADYTSDSPATWSNSTGTTSFTVKPIAPTFNITVSPSSPAVAYQALTFTLTATPVNGAVPTGNVSLTDLGGNVVQTVPLSSGSATVQVATGLPPAAYTFGWKYTNASDPVFSKGGNFGTGDHPLLPFTINKADSTTTTVSSPVNPVFGQPTTFTAVIGPIAPSTGQIFGGTVTFYTAPSVVYVVNGVPQQNIPVIQVGTTYEASTTPNSALAAGSTTVFAVYGGDTNFNASTVNNSGTPTVSPVGTTTVMTSNPAAPATVGVGSTVTYTATVTAAQTNAINPGGTVTFSDNSAAIATCTGVSLSVTGTNSVTATCSQTYAIGTTGTHPVSATYSGNSNFVGSNSNTVQTTVQGAATTTTLDLPAAGGTPTYGSTVNLKATVTSGAGTPTGTVNFLDGVQNIGSATLDGSGVAQATISTLAPGAHSISAQYAGVTNFAISTSGANGITVQQATPTFTITGFPASVSYGSNNSFTVTVNGVGGGATPTGTVTLNNGATQLGSAVTLVSGVATLSIPNTLSPVNSPFTLTVKYQGDTNYSAQTSAGQTLTVNKADITGSLVSNANPASLGQTVTFTFAATSTTSGTPTGNVLFKSDGNPIGASGLVAGAATLSTSTLTAGSHAITADYAGDTTFNGAVGVVLTGNGGNETINAASTTVSVQASPNTPSVGQQVTYTVTVTAPASTPAPVPTASGITISDQGPAGSPVVTACGSVTSISNVTTATCTATYLSPGSHTVTASFNSSNTGQWANGSSTGIPVSVGLTATSTTALASNSGNSYTYGNLTNLSVTVAATGLNFPLSSPITGAVVFLDNGSALCGGSGKPACPVPSNANGLAILSNVVLGGGSHTITAVFQGDSNYGTSNSSVPASQTVTVQKANPTLSAGGAPFTVTFGGGLTTGAITAAGVAQIGSSFVAPTGAVTAASGATVIGSALTGTPAGTTANFTFGVPTPVAVPTSLGVGAGLNLTFTIAADANYNSATFNTTITINKATTNVVVTSATISSLPSGTNPVYGQPIVLTATFSTAGGAGLTAGDTVAFKDGSAVLTSCASQTVTTSGGVSTATCTLPASIGGSPNFAVGSHTIGVQNLSTDPAYTLGTVTPLAFTVAKANSSVQLSNITTPNNVSNPGQTVTFQATVSVTLPGGENPLNTAQTVTFLNGGSAISGACTGVPINAAGVATCSFTFAADGLYNITAQFSGDANVNGSTSGQLVQSTGKPSVTVSLGSSANPSKPGAAVTFTATVTGTNGVTPTGNVQFQDGSTMLGIVTLTGSGGTATAQLTVSTLANGVHTITAAYTGDATYVGSLNAPAFLQTVGAATNISGITVSPSPAVWGQPVTVSVTVTPALPGSGIPTGSVTFYDGVTAIGTVAVPAGSGTVTLTGVLLSVGSHGAITAKYSGDATFGSVTVGTATLVVNKAATTATISNINPSAVTDGQNGIVITAAVTVNTPGAGAPSGTVTFYDGGPTGPVIGTGSVVAGTATLTIAATAPLSSPVSGTHNIVAVYGGDTNFQASTSASSQLTVVKTGTTITVANAAGYSSTNFAPDGATAIFVNNLVSTTKVADTLPLPTSLAGATVTVTDSAGVQRQAPLYFVSPTQINFLMPTSTAMGSATITVSNAGGATASGTILVTRTAPGIFTANQTGQGVAQAVLLDVAPSGNQTRSYTAAYNAASSAWVANAIAMNATDSYYLELYGTGIRYATGQQVSATINGQSVQLLYAGAQSQYPGLDQVDLQIPASLKGAGTVNIVLSVNGQVANTVTVTIQ